MNQPALFDQLMIHLRTTSDVSDVLVCIEKFVDSFFSPQNLQEQQQIFRKLPNEIAKLLITTLAKEPITKENQIIIKRQIDELTDKLHRCKSLQMTIAFQPTEETVSLFSDWVKKNVSKDLLIDLRFDKSIVGGVLLIANGAYKDYTVRKNLANRFQIQKEDIMSLLD